MGFDETMNLLAEVPVPESAVAGLLKNNPQIKQVIANKRLTVPIGGTINKPRLDRNAFAAEEFEGGAAIVHHHRLVPSLGEHRDREPLVHRVLLGEQDPQGMTLGHSTIQLDVGGRALLHAERLAGEGAGQGVEQLRRLDGLGEMGAEAHLLGVGFAAS